MNENIDSSISNNVATKIIDHAEKQNELIFATRKRLFEAEKMQKLSFFLIGLLTLSILLLAVNDTLIKGVING